MAVRSVLLLAVLCFPALSAAGTSSMMVGKYDLILAGGAGFIPGHGAPTGLSLRTGSPGQTSLASFPSKQVLAPGSTVQSISFSFRYVTGYETTPSGHGTNLSLSVSQDTLQAVGPVVYTSPHFTEYAYGSNSSNYSLPVDVQVSGLSIAASSKFNSRLQLAFSNNDRNLQILIPFQVNISCSGAHECLAAPPAPPPPPPPLPPTPPPPATHTPWIAIGPNNIGDSITSDGGESGTLQPVVAAAGNPDIIYTGGNNNAASSGVLKSVNYGKNWVKMNTGLTDTRIHGLFIIDQMGDHVMVGTPSGVYETLTGGASWVHVTQTQGWGVANTFRNGTINGGKYLFVGTNAGLGNVPLVQTPLLNEKWNLIPSPPGHSAFRTNAVSISDYRAGVLLPNSVVGGCLWVGGHGVVHIGTVINETAMDWTFQLDQPCQSMAMDPNDANHMLVNNASNGAHIYESTDGGATFHGCLNYRGAVMVAIDRTGWYYVGSEGGIYRNSGGNATAVGTNTGGCISGKWEAMFNRRIARRPPHGVRDKVAHDFQGINIDFGGHPGGVAFGSDQGMFMKNMKNVSDLQFISGNGDMNNNIIMHPSIAMGEEPNTRYIVTAMWDWAPVASWDNGTHWPSWQIPDDGGNIQYLGEGGGCFGVGESKNSLCIHHHNVAWSGRGGKGYNRLVVGHGASVGGPEFERLAGSRSVPSGHVYATMSMGMPPWDTYTNKEIVCNSTEVQGDLGVHTSYSCLSHVDIGLMYRWFPGVNVAVWRGSTDKHCVLCKMSGQASTWSKFDSQGVISYALQQDAIIKEIDEYDREALDDTSDNDSDDGSDDSDHEGPDDDNDSWKHKMEKQRQLEFNATASEWNAVMPKLAYAGKSNTELAVGGAGGRYTLKSWNYGQNWTWVLLPDYLQSLGGYTADPTNQTLYGVVSNCISRSYDQAVTWDGCWEAPGLVGSFRSIVIKDSKTMLVLRNGDVPLRTKDGGASWEQVASLQNIAHALGAAAYSWSGKTLAVSGNAGQLFVWVSRDDGDTWVDESGDYTSMSGGIAQWYDNTLYICSLGQGISAKVFQES